MIQNQENKVINKTQILIIMNVNSVLMLNIVQWEMYIWHNRISLQLCLTCIKWWPTFHYPNAYARSRGSHLNGIFLGVQIYPTLPLLLITKRWIPIDPQKHWSKINKKILLCVLSFICTKKTKRAYEKIQRSNIQAKTSMSQRIENAIYRYKLNSPLKTKDQ